MSTVPEENWWNTSSNSSFNFDDEEETKDLTSQSEEFLDFTNTNLVFGSDVDSNTTLLPLQSLISKENFNLSKEDVRLLSASTTSYVQETVLKMVLGMPYNLYVYRNLEQKLELLDEAINSHDGNVILAVLLFLKKTLKANLLRQHIAERKAALQHYISYLMKLGDVEELANLYMITGNMNDVIYLFFIGYKATSNKTYIHKKLSRFLIEHQSKLSRTQAGIFAEYTKFLTWQIEKNTLSNSVIQQLANLCKNNCENIGSVKLTIDFKDLFKINDFQYEWTLSNALCASQKWKLISDFFVKPNWLSKKNSFKSVIDAELFVITLHKHDAPKGVLEEFLVYVDNSEAALTLAKKMQCHKFVIDSYASYKSKSLLWSYKKDISAQPEAVQYAENALSSMDKKK